MFAADLLRYGIVEMSSTGRSIGVIGSRGSGPGRFEVPTGVAVDGRGPVFASDGVNASVQGFVPASGGYRFARSFFRRHVGAASGRLVQPLALAVAGDGSRVYVGDYRYGIVSFTEQSRFLATWSPGPTWTIVSLAPGPGAVLYATFNGPQQAQVSYRISPDLRSRHVLGLANPAGPRSSRSTSPGGSTCSRRRRAPT